VTDSPHVGKFGCCLERGLWMSVCAYSWEFYVEGVGIESTSYILAHGVNDSIAWMVDGDWWGCEALPEV